MDKASIEKSETINHILKIYTPTNRLEYCRLLLTKYQFAKYKLSDFNIKNEDFIVQNEETRQMAQTCLDKKSCNHRELFDILNRLTQDQIDYIGI